MLVDVTLGFADPGLNLVLSIVGTGQRTRRVSTGIYFAGHWSVDEEVREKTVGWPELPGDLNAYGVCDTPEQVFARCPEIVTGERKFFVSFVEVLKSAQSADGGWRWHKWGPYIGEHKPEHEYLYDEPVIERVLTYHVYEVVAERRSANG